MKQTKIIVIEVQLEKPIDDLATLIAQRVYTIDGIIDTNVITEGIKHD